MKYQQKNGEVRITDLGAISLEQTFACGQCFRWNRDESGGYTGVALGHAARIRQDGGDVFITGTTEEFETVWRGYFDLDRDYETIRRSLCIDAYMSCAASFGAGIRLLRQDRWEVLCSFIISQCNNIPRIKKIVEQLCASFGDPVELDGTVHYTFPSAERIAGLVERDLSPLRCGYRAPFLIGAAKAVAAGEVDFDELVSCGSAAALCRLKMLPGVGDKVANCFLLFGLQKLDAFPVDVWVGKALRAHYGKGFDPSAFGGYAGLAQQYMFFYERSKGSDRQIGH